MTMYRGRELLGRVEEWYRDGFTPLPLHYKTKRAAVQWSDWASRRPTWPRVLEAFDHKFYRNLGILCGAPSGNLIVLDFDMPLHYFKWRKRHGIATYTVRTNRGFHVYVRLDEPAPGTASMRGGEIKGSGYVVAPPSTHPSGVEYKRQTGSPRAVSRAVNLKALGITPEFAGGPEIAPSGSSGRVSGRQPQGETLTKRIKSVLPLTRLLSQHTELYASGRGWYVCRCPFHDDHSPSMWVNARAGLCQCFKPGCRGRGNRPMDVINLYAALNRLSNGEAIAELARRLGL